MRIEKKNLMDVLQSDEVDNSEETNDAEKTSTYVKTSVIFSKAYEDAKTQESTYEKPVDENGITKENVMQEAKGMDATMMRDQMLFSVNTTTSKDSEQMKEDGFALHDTDIQTVITETDKIKLQLAKAGVDISYMGGGLSKAKLQEMTGSATQTAELEKKIQDANLPTTEDNVTDTKETFDMAASLKKLTEGAMKYMLDNKCVPSVANLYRAQFSGSASYMSSQGMSDTDFSQMQSQITGVIANAGLAVSDTSLKNSEWMITNNVSFTSSNLKYMTTLQNLTLPPSSDAVMSSISQAVTDGNRPQDALVAPGFSLMDRAQNAKDVIDQATDEDVSYVVDNRMELTISNLSAAQRQIQANPYLYNQAKVNPMETSIASAATATSMKTVPTDDQATKSDTVTVPSNQDVISATNQISSGNASNQNSNSQTDDQAANQQQANENGNTPLTFVKAKRQLEEVRLAMSAQANYTLLKQGISIDTRPLSQLVDDLKSTENQYYSNLLTGCNANASASNISLFKSTSDTVNELKSMPAYALGLHATRDVTTLNSLHETASVMQDKLTKANQTYETMMTKPRSDLGDSITKTFKDIDSMLQDLDMDTTDANQRAVRILAYNSMDITKENITNVKSVDEQVQAAFKNLSPAVVRQMIKCGTNPLDMNLTQLNEATEEISKQLDTAGSEKFSEYLWKLEQNNDISEDERNSYIGIYRLMNQVEQTDGAAVGTLLTKGSNVTMRNLLSAVRTSKGSGIDIKVDDSTGETLNNDESNTLSITDQIQKGYQTDCIKNAFSLATPGRLKSIMNNEAWQDMTPEAFLGQLRNTKDDEKASDEYQTQQVNEFAKTVSASEDVYSLLEKYDIQNTASNVMALQEMMSNRNGAYRKLFQEVDSTNENDNSSSSDTSLSDATKEMIETYGDAVKTPESMKQAIDQLEETASGALSNFIGSKTDITSMKVKEMKLMYKQVALAGQMANKETYSFPVVIQNEITNVNLKIVRGQEAKGLVNITFETDQLGKVATQLSYDSKNITGYIACDNKNTKNTLQTNQNQLISALSNSVSSSTSTTDTTSENQPQVSLQMIVNQPIDLNQFLEHTKNAYIGEESTDTSNQVQTKTLYKMAESFIKTAKALVQS